MRLEQLKYVVEIYHTHSLSQAAKTSRCLSRRFLMRWPPWRRNGASSSFTA